MSDWVWRKSSFSNGGNNNCVEVGFAGQAIVLRDTKNPDSGLLTLSPTAWRGLTHVLRTRDGA